MIYAFEDFVLDTERLELSRASRRVDLEPQVFDLLLYLVKNRERVVSKDDLIEGVWNGRIVSESALSSRITAVRHAVGDSGEEQRLIRTIPRKGLRFVGAVREEPAAADALAPVSAPPILSSEVRIGDGSVSHPPTLALPDKPSIVVLPFANLSGDPSQEYFADGMVEDITIGLGRHSWLFVIGSIAAFTYKGRAADARQIGAELGVRYVLRGSVRKEGSRLRITAELTDAATSGHIWADRFEGELESVFEMQDRVAAQVSAAITPALRFEEMRRARRKPTESLSAYDLFLRALQQHTVSLSHNEEALRLLGRAIELDPSYGAAYGLAAWCHFWQKIWGWTAPSDSRLEEAVRLARMAAELGADDSEALWMAGQTLSLIAGDLEHALLLIDRSLALNPNAPNAWWADGMTRLMRGGAEVERGIESQWRAWRLNPVDPWAYYYLTGVAIGHFFAGRYEEAAKAADRPLGREPAFPPLLRLKAAVSGLLGRTEEGRAYVKRLREVNPGASLATIKAYYAEPLRDMPEALESFLVGLRRSGLLEE